MQPTKDVRLHDEDKIKEKIKVSFELVKNVGWFIMFQTNCNSFIGPFGPFETIGKAVKKFASDDLEGTIACFERELKELKGFPKSPARTQYLTE